jgi:hypothetical protein
MGAVSGKPSIPPPNTVQTLPLPPSQYEDKINKLRNDLTQGQRKIIQKLEELKEDEETTNQCVCNKTLTTTERDSIINKINERRKDLEELKKEIETARSGGSNKSSKKNKSNPSKKNKSKKNKLSK